MVGGSFVLHQGTSRSPLITYAASGQTPTLGHTIKILTNLTDEEMARLKYVRRLYWHWRGSRTAHNGKDTIADQELADRGIKNDPEPYIEYVKRPPHDKYL